MWIHMCQLGALALVEGNICKLSAALTSSAAVSLISGDAARDVHTNRRVGKSKDMAVPFTIEVFYSLKRGLEKAYFAFDAVL